MSLRAAGIAHAVGFAILLSINLACGQARPAPPADRPTYTVGTRWLHADAAYELKRVDAGSYVFVAGTDREIRLSNELAVVSVRRGNDYVEFSRPPRLKWPLKAGDWGTTDTAVRVSRWPTHRAPNPAYVPSILRVVWQVRAAGEVRVPAGSFTAFRIDYEVVAQSGFISNNIWNFSMWYAPAAQQFVKAEDGGAGLLSFELAAESGAQPSVASPAMPAPAVGAAPPARPAVPAPVPDKGVTREPVPPALASPPPPTPGTPADTEAPKIALNYPPADATIDRDEIVVLGLVTDNVAVDRVIISVNGKVVVMSPDSAMSSRSYSIRAPATLFPGENVIEITAVDRAGNGAQLVRTVKRPAAVASPLPPPPEPKRDQWAVVIGIGAYDNPGIPRLQYSVADAEAVYRTLIGAGGFKKDNVILFTDRSERKPTLKNIKWALGTFLARVAKKDDTVLIFFAGHGAPETDPRGIERDGLAKYLIPSDADSDDLYSTAFPMDELQTIFGRIEADRVIAFLDACYSGAAGGRTFAAKKTRAGAVDDLFLERLTRSKGRAIITASRPTEVSIELPDLGHGIFTYYLVEGLKGAADLNRDGIVTLQELYEYVEQQVTRKSRSVGGSQHPVMKGELEGVVPLIRVGR